MGSAHSGWTTLGLPQPKVACASWVHTAQSPGCSARGLSQVGPAFRALPRSKSLRFSVVLQGHRPRWAVQFVPFAGLSSSSNWVLGECTVPGGLCVLFTCLVTTVWFPGCTMRALSLVYCVSPQVADLRLQCSRQMSTVQYPRKTWLATGTLLTVWWRMLASAAEIVAACCLPALTVTRMLSFKPAFSLFSYTLIRGSLVPLCFSAMGLPTWH